MSKVVVPQTTLNLEDMFTLGARHIERLVDVQGRTYFDVFRTTPPEAVTDWPDFVDLPARYWEAIAMIEPVLGISVSAKPRLRSWLSRHFEADGLAYRPDTLISHHTAELFDQSRLLYALVTWAVHDPADAEVRQWLSGMVEGLRRKATFQDDYAFVEKIGLYFGGTLIRPMLQAGVVLGREDLVDFACKLARGLALHSDLIGPAGEFSGHMHAALSAIGGVIACGIRTGDRQLLERGKAGFDFARTQCTDFGFVPELAQHKDDLIACETCTIMDYLDCALLLARHVDPAYWDVVEKTTRNHLWESQIRDGSWLGPVGGTDEEGIIRSDLHDRVIGSFAGWSAPHCTLAYDEYLMDGWVRSEEKRPTYLKKVRAIQNCCAGGGIRPVYQVWSNIITSDNGVVSVNVSLDRTTPDVRVISFIPFEGRVRLEVLRDCRLRWRPPAHCHEAEMQVRVGNGAQTAIRSQTLYMDFGRQMAGTVIEISFPLPERDETITIGNAGYQQYRFDLRWRGDTVVSMTPDPANATTGFASRMNMRMPTYYAVSGPGPLYQRQGWTEGLRVSPARVAQTPANVDWYQLA